MTHELIGYAASVLVAVSLMMSSILRLRLINLGGAALFAIYGALIGSTPVAVVNIFIVCVNLYYLARIFGANEYFRILEVRPESAYLRHFLEHNRADIARFLPEFSLPVTQPAIAFFILRDVIPAGVVLGEPRADGSLRIQLDYVLPGYRDFKIGDFLFRQQAGFFAEKGIRRLVAHASTRRHADYLRRMGFDARDDYGESCYVRDI